MGEVYKAQDPLLNRFVAIKTIAPALAAEPDFRRRFQREAQSAAALNHPNIVTDLRLRRGGRPRLHGHGAARGPRPQGPHPRARRPPRRQARDHGAALRRPRLRARAGASSTATSSRATSTSSRTARSRSSTSAWPAWATPTSPGRARSWARPTTCRRSRSAARRSTRRSDVFSLGARLLRAALPPPPVRGGLRPRRAPPIVGAGAGADPEVGARRPSGPRRGRGAGPRQGPGPPLRGRRRDGAGARHRARRRSRATRSRGPAARDGGPDDAAGRRRDRGPARRSPAPPTATRAGSDRAHPRPRAGRRRRGATCPGRSGPIPPSRAGRPRRLPRAPAARVRSSSAAPRRSWWRSRWASCGCARAARSPARRRPRPAAEQAGIMTDVFVTNQVELARADLADRDYAVGRPARRGGPEAQPGERGRARGARAGPAGAAPDRGRRGAGAGRLRRGTSPGRPKALGRVMALAPRHPVVAELSAALKEHLRPQAEDSRRQAEAARKAADGGSGPVLAGLAAGQAARHGGGHAPPSAGLRERRAEVPRVAQRLRAGEAGGGRGARRGGPAPLHREAAPLAAPPPGPPRRFPRRPPRRPARPSPLPTAAAAPTAPPTAAPLPVALGEPRPRARPPADAADAAVRRVIAEYGRAIGSQDLALFRSLKPDLSADEEKRLREAFKVIKSQVVGITVESVQIDGRPRHGAGHAPGRRQRAAHEAGRPDVPAGPVRGRLAHPVDRPVVAAVPGRGPPRPGNGPIILTTVSVFRGERLTARPGGGGSSLAGPRGREPAGAQGGSMVRKAALLLVVALVPRLAGLGPGFGQAGPAHPQALRAGRPQGGQPGAAARRQHPLGPLQQRLPGRVHPVQHRARQPARRRSPAHPGLGLHLHLRQLARRLPALDPELRADPDRARGDDRQGQVHLRRHLPALRLRQPRGAEPRRRPRRVHPRRRPARGRPHRPRHHDERHRRERRPDGRLPFLRPGEPARPVGRRPLRDRGPRRAVGRPGAARRDRDEPGHALLRRRRGRLRRRSRPTAARATPAGSAT